MKTFKLKFDKAKSQQKGFALISVLLILLVLTITVTAFLANMRIERIAARNILNITQAQLAAEAGLTEALIKLTDGLTNYHYVTVDEIDASNTNYHKPYLLRFQYGTTNIVATNYMYTAFGNETNIIQIADGIVRNVGYTSLFSEGNTNVVGRYGYWIDEANSKQNVFVAKGKPREYLTNLNELPLLTREGTPFSSSDLANAAANNTTSLLLTPQTLNQVVPNLNPKADDFDYTFRSPTALLTPEGHPRLNLNRLKVYIDGGDFDEGNGTIVNYPGLYTQQGSSSERVQLINQLLNIDNNYPPDAKNPWGYGSLQIIRKLYSISEARQTVANLIDYIDADIIPTTDGNPGPAPKGGNYALQEVQNFNPSDWILPTPEEKATFLGVEARVQNNLIQGHPYITYVGIGFIFNPAGGGNQINSTRIIGTLGVANPWSTEIPPWGSGSANGYYPEIQVIIDGTVNGGTRGAEPQVPDSNTGYFMNAWLAQRAGGATKVNGELSAHSFAAIPRQWGDHLDYGNGYYNFLPNKQTFTINDFGTKLEVCRLIEVVDGQRFLVQELSDLKDKKTRELKPSNYSVSGGIIKYPYQQKDWHYEGDPRMNFLVDNWKVEETSGGANGPYSAASGIDVYNTPSNGQKDGAQDMSVNTLWWNDKIIHHFPTYEQGYRPSPDIGKSAMQSLAELGFLHTGRPWQTLKLYADKNKQDWRILQYVDLGLTEHQLNELNQIEIDGKININSKKISTLRSVFTGIENVSQAQANFYADELVGNSFYPIFNIGEILSIPSMKNSKNYDFEKEDFIGRFVNSLTTASQAFTVYVVGENRFKNRTLAKSLLKAEVELSLKESNGKLILTPTIIRKSFL